MIMVFGAVMMGTFIKLEPEAARPKTHIASEYEIGIGGRGAIQSYAAARSAEKVVLISHIGDDHYGKNILLRIRQQGVVTSGVARHPSTQTGTIVKIGRRNPQHIIALGANTHANHEQVPDSIIDKETVLLIQDELSHEQNAPVIAKAKANGARVIFNAGVRGELKKYNLSEIDYVITSSDHEDVIKHMKSKAPHKLITVNKQGGCTHTPKNHAEIKIPNPEIKGHEWVDATAAEDAFCGTFTSGIYQNRDIEQALTRASYASFLTGCKVGGCPTIPYLDILEETINMQLEN